MKGRIRKQRENDRESKRAQRNNKGLEISSDRNETNFRFLAFQPISLTLQDPKPFKLSIQQMPCCISLRNLNVDDVVQRTKGGMFIVIDFSLKNETDMIRATNRGLGLIEDFLSAVSLAEGAMFSEVEPIQIIRYEKAKKQRYSMIHYLNLSLKHFYKPISTATLLEIRSLLAHWDGLDSGKRLRRAARQFQKAKNTRDVLLAFQHAYMGLEAMDKPLADAQRIPSGVEEIKGKCDHCGKEYVKKRSALAGVQSYIYGDFHRGTDSSERREEWKKINELRHILFHSLQDTDEFVQRVETALPAAMHYLHDSICCMSHSHSLESNRFELFRGVIRHVFRGQFSSPPIGAIDKWIPLFEVKVGSWKPHPEFGSVPEFSSKNNGIKDLEIAAFYLAGQIDTASESDLKLAHMAHNSKKEPMQH